MSLTTISVFFRSLLFSLLLPVSLAAHSAAIVVGVLLPHAYLYGIVVSFGRTTLWLLEHVIGLKYEITGSENIPDTPSVVYLKHESVWETLAELVIFPRQCWVLKRELLWIPVVGWALLKMRCIAINRNAHRTALEQVVEQGTRRLASGLWVMIFPEGTRVAPGKSRRYGLSGAVLASAAGCKIVPVAHNAGDFWPRRRFMKYPGVVRVIIGPAIDAVGRSPVAINREAKDWIEARLTEIRATPPDEK